MKLLHIIHPDRKFARVAVLFIEKHFNPDEHDILYVNEKGNSSLIQKDVTLHQIEFFIKGKFDFWSCKNILSELERYDFIILHSLFHHLLLKLLFCFNSHLLSKMVWVEFGGDLYLKHSIDILSNLTKRLTRLLAERCAAFVGIFPPDCDYFKSMYPHTRAEVFYAPYSMPDVENYIKNYKLRNHIERGKSPLVVQVGHNGDETLNHIEVIKMLSKFKNERINLLLIQSYGGSDSYRDSVQSLAEAIFPSKVIVLRDFLPLDKYLEVINKVEIAIFNTYRQAGLGNIYKMICNGIKIYMPSNSVMYTFFKSKGIPIQKLEDIENLSFLEFSDTNLSYDNEIFNSYMKDFSSIEWRVACWEKVYRFLRDKCHG